MDTNQSEWIAAFQVASELGSIGADPMQLVYLAQDGIVEARAGVFLSDYALQTELRAEVVDLPPPFWRNFVRNLQRPTLWDRSSVEWHTGSFGCLDDEDRPVKAVDVRFQLESVMRGFPRVQRDNLFKQPSELSGSRSVKSRGGAPRESEKWDAVIVALVRLALAGKLDRGTSDGFKKQTHLRTAILDDKAVANLGVKDETIKPTIAKLWREVIDPDGPVER